MKPTIVLHSPLAPDAVVATLCRSIDEERRALFSSSSYKGSLPVTGEVGDTKFRLQKRRYYNNSFAPQFYGEFQAEPGGTRIEGYFDFSRWVKVFMRFWLEAVS